MKYLLTALAALFIGIILEIHRYVAKPQGEKTPNQTIAKLWIYVRPIGSFLYFWSAFLACNQILEAFVPWVVGRKQFFLEFVWTLAATISMLLINQSVYLTKESLRRKIERSIAQWFLGVLTMVTTVASSKYFLETSVFLMALSEVVVLVGTSMMFVKRGGCSRKVRIIDIGTLFLLAIMIFVFGEILYCKDPSFRIDFLLINSTVYFLVLLLVMVIFKSWNLAISLGPIMGFLWTMVFVLVYEFRGTVFQPSDVTAVGTAKEVMRAYSFHANRSIVVYLMFVIVCCSLSISCTRVRVSFRTIPKRILSTCAVVFMVILLYLSSWTDAVDFQLVSTWDLPSIYNYLGYTLGFLEIAKASEAKKPEGYNVSNIESLTVEYSKKTSSGVTGIKPNIIVIMNETLADLGDLGELEVNKDYFPFIHACNKKKNTITGRTLVPVLGGGTCNSEYEFLTGNSTEFLPMVYAFQTEINSETYSIVSTLKNQGYYAIGTHPNHATNWNRSKVYHYLGFDKSYFYEDYLNPVPLRASFATYDMLGSFVSDESVYDNLIRMMNEKPKDSPCFLFAVTMQNHGGYDGKTMLRESDKEFAIHGVNTRDTVIDQFLSLMYESDKAFKKLIHKIDQLQEPTIVVMFGDHFPGFSNSYSKLKDEDTSGLESLQKSYSTPYIIHANYDIELNAVSEYMSLNYLACNILKVAGLKTTPYDNYLLDMEKEIPAINANGYLTRDGVWHGYEDSDANSANSRINEYNCMQYNIRFGKIVDELFKLQ